MMKLAARKAWFKTPQDTEEAVQIALVRLLEAHQRGSLPDESQKLQSYAYRTLHRLAIDSLRRTRSALPMQPLPRPGDTVAEPYNDLVDHAARSPLEIADSRERLAAVQRAIAQIGPEHRAVIQAIVIEGRSLRECADLIPGATRSTLSRRLAEALIAISKALTDHQNTIASGAPPTKAPPRG
jgi:RNA polymerase sigma factor (sigma-70 family)